MKKYRKALNSKYACPDCGNHIGLCVNHGYTCDWCGYTVKQVQIAKNNGCLCWLAEEICPVHGLCVKKG